MRLSDLKRYAIPDRIIELWRQRHGEQLLPVQRRAIRKGLLNRTDRDLRNLIICAPTSSGKSFCAEMAAVKALIGRRKAVMLFPLKSLAEENYRLLSSAYGPLGIKCLIATGDHPENDRRFAEGDYQLAVAIYEKFDQLLTNRLDVLKNTGSLVVDELQMVAEKGRGAVLERLLTRVRASRYNPVIIGLSAVVGEEAASGLAGWLEAEVVEETARPVDLMRGVAAGGTFRYRSYNSGQDSSEPFAQTEIGQDAVDGFIDRIKDAEGQTLVFVKSRQDTVHLAFRLASNVSWPAAGTGLKRLAGEEPTYLTRSLKQAMGRGVAFHNSDLSPEQRQVVEQAFLDKEIKVVFSTTTLAMGVNLPADTVYLETVKYDSGVYDDRPTLMPVSRSEFDNMTGRAGRLGLSDDRPGRAIVMAESDFDREILWEQYIAPVSPEPVGSAFESLAMEDWLLHLIVCGLVGRKADIAGVLGHSYRAAIDSSWEPEFEEGLESLLEAGLVESGGSGELAATVMGKAVGSSGLTVTEAVRLLRLLEDHNPESRLGWTALALSAPGWALPPGILSRAEQGECLPLKTLYQRFDHAVGEVDCLIGADHRHRPLTYRQAASLKALLLLDDWCRLTPVQKLEEMYQLHLGQILALGETAAHRLTALSMLLHAVDRESPTLELLQAYAFSVRNGLPEEYQGFCRRLGGTLNRSDFVALRQAGITGIDDLAGISHEELKRVIESDAKCKEINAKVQLSKEEVDMSAAGMSFRPMANAEPDSVVIDGSLDRERYVVRINGFPVRLTGKSFKYFTKLAWSRLNRDSGWVYKEDIEIGFNQARYLYRMKNEIRDGLGSPWSVVENNRLGYYRLNVSPDKISINTDNLRNFPDFEVQSLVQGVHPGYEVEASAAVQ